MCPCSCQQDQQYSFIHNFISALHIHPGFLPLTTRGVSLKKNYIYIYSIYIIYNIQIIIVRAHTMKQSRNGHQVRISMYIKLFWLLSFFTWESFFTTPEADPGKLYLVVIVFEITSRLHETANRRERLGWDPCEVWHAHTGNCTVPASLNWILL